MAVIHSGGDDDKTAHSQKAGGGARGSADAPVFVGSHQEYFAHMRSVNPSATRWIYPRFVYAVPAVVYGLFFWIAGSLFPQFYQAWLDFCMPLVEYVAGLSPRSERVSAQLIAGGYPERVDDARHGIAMAWVMLTPLYVCFLVAFVYALTKTPPTVISCGRRTRTHIWIANFLALCFGVLLLLAWEYLPIFSEDFEYRRFGSMDDYHRSNRAIFFDMAMKIWGFFIALGVWRFLMMRAVRFNIVD